MKGMGRKKRRRRITEKREQQSKRKMGNSGLYEWRKWEGKRGREDDE